MSNFRNERVVQSSLEKWVNNPGIKRGILSVYNNESFDYDSTSPAYELGRQIALLAKSKGLITRGSILRRKPNSEVMAIVKTKMTILSDIIYKELSYHPSQMVINHFG